VYDGVIADGDDLVIVVENELDAAARRHMHDISGY
jgi:hypothetical protein